MAKKATHAEEKTVLISGCPRSGTSWIHFLLAAHPDTVSCRETHVYDKYVGPLKDWFDSEHTLQGLDGLSAIFSEEDFIREILAPIVQTTLSRIRLHAKKNHVLIEKTPGNILQHHLISSIQPDARLLFITRDPRSVYASFKAASQQPWGSWTRKSIAEFCNSWNKYTTAYLAAKHIKSDDRLMCVRYEDMKADGHASLSRILDWAGLDKPEGFVEQALKDNSIDNLRNAKEGTLQHDKRPGFYRVGKMYGWVQELELAEIREIEANCLNLMTVMGYSKFNPQAQLPKPSKG